MKKLIKGAALSLSLAMLLSGAALGEAAVEEQAQSGETVQTAQLADDQLIMTVNGHRLLKSDFDETATLLEENGYSSDYVTVYNYLKQAELFEYAFGKYGLNQFTQEQKDAFLTQAQDLLEENIRSYMDYFKTSETPTDAELAELRSQAEAYFSAQGFTPEELAKSLETSACYDALEIYLTETYQMNVTPEEVAETFAALAQDDRQRYEGQVPMYEFYTQYYGQESYYVPEGYRGVLQILLDVDDALLEEYTTKQAALEEQMSGEEEAQTQDAGTEEATQAPAETPVPVTQEDVERAREAILAASKETIDEIKTRLANGEAFIDLIPEYNIDPGMQQESYLRDGYLVHKDSVLYDPAFVSAAFDKNMNQVGDVSDPAVGSYGIYIVYYLRDAGGQVEMTDEIANQLSQDLLSNKLNAKYVELLGEWEAESEIQYEQEAFTRLTGLTFEDGKPVQQPEEEAVPVDD